MNLSNELKIVISGTTGSGKSTAIHAVSEILAVSADVRNTDPNLAKELTTAGLDYGEITLDNSEKLRLYGTPGQERFEFMWRILANGALGIILLIDNNCTDPLAEMDIYLSALVKEGQRTPCVVALTHTDEGDYQHNMNKLAAYLESKGALYPVVAADVRQSEQVVGLMELLLLQIEAMEVK